MGEYMNDIGYSKFLDKKKISVNKNNDHKKFKDYFTSLVVRVLISIILLVVMMIFTKGNFGFKNYIVKNIYENTFSFTSLNNWYREYLGGVIPFDNLFVDYEMVFNEKLKYSKKEKYLDGVKLSVSHNYLVPVLESGIVVFIGEKEGLGNTIIIQGMSGVDLWYSNIDTATVSMYDYVEKGNVLGEVVEDSLILTFSKENKYLDYEEYLSLY